MATASDQQLLDPPRPASRARPAADATPLWLWPNLLSLDAPLVAVVWQEAFAAALAVPLGWAERAVLFGAVWLVYAGDRWLDAWRLPTPSTPRHRFAARHRRALFTAIVVVFPLTAWLAGHTLDAACLRAGLFLTGPVLAYLALAHFFPRVRLPKEAVIACLFAAGVAAFPLAEASARDWPRVLATLPAIAGLAVLAALNCLSIERWEAAAGVRVLPLLRAALWLARLAAVAVVLGFLSGTGFAATVPYVGVLVGAAGLAFLLANSHLSLDARRVLADAVLLGPVILWVL